MRGKARERGRMGRWRGGVRGNETRRCARSVPREMEKSVVIGVVERIASALLSSRNGGFGRAQEILSTLRERRPVLFSLTAALRHLETHRFRNQLDSRLENDSSSFSILRNVFDTCFRFLFSSFFSMIKKRFQRVAGIIKMS